MRVAAVLMASAALVVACGGGGGDNSTPSTSNASGGTTGKPVTITLWNGFTNRELGVVQQAVDAFHQAHPSITVKVVGGINDDKIIAAIRGGNSPDVAQSSTADNTGAFCGSGGWIDLKPYMAKDHVDASAFPKAVQYYTSYQGTQCALPMLADTYGLYYNKALFKKAGIASPPKTMSELAADAKKLTQKNPDGTFKVVGYDPAQGFYENAPAHYGPVFGAKWVDDQGKSALAAGGWDDFLKWSKELIDFYGYDKLTRWQAGAGDEFSPQNAFERGKLAMNIDG